MRLIAKIALAAALLCACAVSQGTPKRYFPERAISSNKNSDKLMVDWYSLELETLQEPSLWQQSQQTSSESYRFLWLRTFHKPIAIRLEIRSDGSGLLTTKVGSGASGFPRTSKGLTENVSRPVLRQQTELMRKKINAYEFWAIPSHLDTVDGNDGAEWILEGVKNGKYHVVTRWSPNTGAIRDMGLSFVFGLAQMEIPKDEIY